MSNLKTLCFGNDCSDIPSGGGAGLESITYSALKAKRDGGTLTPGGQYRITDYVCTTTQDESRAVSHPYDIIVVADSASVLNENARAIAKDNDTYYQYADLSAWELKYCLDNDANRFKWADTTNGKGVVYWLKDDHGNECPYDFKQIQFKRYENPDSSGEYITGSDDEENPIWCYTFSYDLEGNGTMSDTSIMEFDKNVYREILVSNNKIRENFAKKNDEDFLSPIVMYLNSNVLFGCSCKDNTFGLNSSWNTLNNNCSYNTLGDNCMEVNIGSGCKSNTFGHDCSFINFTNGQYYTFLSGTQGSIDYPINIEGTGSYWATYVGLNSQDMVMAWVLADTAPSEPS